MAIARVQHQPNAQCAIPRRARYNNNNNNNNAHRATIGRSSSSRRSIASNRHRVVAVAHSNSISNRRRVVAVARSSNNINDLELTRMALAWATDVFRPRQANTQI